MLSLAYDPGGGHQKTPFNTPLEMLDIMLYFEITNSGHRAFNTPLEMLGVLVFGFCGFLSFCVGVCGFLRRLVDCGYLGYVFVLVHRGQ